MKYFTPERYLRLGNLSDEQAFLAAQTDWEVALAAYKDHLQHIRAALPAGLLRLLDTVYLHDARILDMWQGRRSRFTITLQPESDPSRLVILTYSLVEPPSLTNGRLPHEAQSEPTAWLYDELNIEPTTNKGRRRGKETVVTHDILLSNGWELRLRFRKVSVARPLAVIPATTQDRSASVVVARSA